MSSLRLKFPTFLLIALATLSVLLALSAGATHSVGAFEGNCSPDLNEYQLNIDGVDLTVCVPFNLEFVESPTDQDIFQVGSGSSPSDQITLMIQAVPYDFDYRVMKIPVPKAGSTDQVRDAVASGYLDINRVLAGPKANFFGVEVGSIYSLMPSETYNDTPTQVLKIIWVIEAGDRVWIIHFEQKVTSDVSDSLLTPSLEGMSKFKIVSSNLEAPSTSMALGAMESERLPDPIVFSSTEGDLPSPSWWNGYECDSNFFPGSSPLGGIYRGVKACGPRSTAKERSFGVGVSQLEWQCAELSKRYIFLAYGTPPYSAPGKDVVNNYPRTDLIKIANGTSGKAPVAGDILSYSGPDTQYGHTSVVKSSSVNSTTGTGSITVIEQNASAGGEATLSVTAWHVGSTVTNWLHQPTQDSPSGYVYCTNEGGYCGFSGSATIAFGANGVYTYKNLTGGTACTTAVFGDPISGVQKSCYISGGGPIGYTFCASENQRCNVPSLANIAYGASLSYLYKNNVTGGVDCNSATFGGDPISGTIKGCYYQLQNAPQGNWTAKYYSTLNYWWDDQSPQYYQCEESINSNTYTLNKDYGSGAPCGNGMSADNWVGNYTASINFPSGNYVFWIDHDDGLKLWLDGVNIADVGGSGSYWVCPGRQLSGSHNLRAKLREDGGNAKIIVNWSTDTGVCDPPMAFSKLTPYNTSNNLPVNPTISWNQSTKATWYEYCIDTVNNNTCDASWVQLQNVTSFGLSGLSAGTTYYWQVRAVNPYSPPTQADGGTWWSISTVPIAPADFDKTSPLNNSANQPINLALSWNSSNRANGYAVCYDTLNDNACNTQWVDSGGSTYFDLIGLSKNTTYYWSVKAINPGGEAYANGGVWWSFSTKSQTNVFLSFLPIVNGPLPMRNANFEEGHVAWTENSSSGFNIIENISALSHSGSWVAWLGGGNNETSTLSQSISTPSQAPYMHYWYSDNSEDICGYDFFRIKVNGAQIFSKDLCASNGTGGWIENVLNLSAYAGTTITIAFEVTTDVSNISSAFVDDIVFSASSLTSLDIEKPVNTNIQFIRQAP